MLLLKHRIKGFSFEYLLRFLSIIDMPTEIQSDCETYDQTIDIDCGTINSVLSTLKIFILSDKMKTIEKWCLI